MELPRLDSGQADQIGQVEAWQCLIALDGQAPLPNTFHLVFHACGGVSGYKEKVEEGPAGLWREFDNFGDLHGSWSLFGQEKEGGLGRGLQEACGLQKKTSLNRQQTM